MSIFPLQLVNDSYDLGVGQFLASPARHALVDLSDPVHILDLVLRSRALREKPNYETLLLAFDALTWGAIVAACLAVAAGMLAAQRGAAGWADREEGMRDKLKMDRCLN